MQDCHVQKESPVYCGMNYQLGMLLQAVFWQEGSSGHSSVKNSFFQHGGCSLIYLWTFIVFEHHFGDIVNEFHCRSDSKAEKWWLILKEPATPFESSATQNEWIHEPSYNTKSASWFPPFSSPWLERIHDPACTRSYSRGRSQGNNVILETWVSMRGGPELFTFSLVFFFYDTGH